MSDATNQQIFALLQKCPTLDEYIAQLQQIRADHGNLKVTTRGYHWEIQQVESPKVAHIGEPRGRKRKIEYFHSGFSPAEAVIGAPVVRIG